MVELIRRALDEYLDRLDDKEAEYKRWKEEERARRASYRFPKPRGLG